MHTHLITGSIVGAGVLLLGTLLFTGSSAPPAPQALAGAEIEFFRSPTCGCCGGHADALEEAGADVSVTFVDDVELQEIKREHGIPFTKQSCHTALMDGYVLEGHIPIDALAQLRDRKPDTTGITLPGMPIGTPGMPGPQREPYIVETLDGEEFWRKDLPS